jgi:hypothetical protein
MIVSKEIKGMVRQNTAVTLHLRPEDGPVKGPKHVVFSLNKKAPSNITVVF